MSAAYREESIFQFFTITWKKKLLKVLKFPFLEHKLAKYEPWVKSSTLVCVWLTSWERFLHFLAVEKNK